MGKRHERHKFMPGKFVFPGGRVEPEDRRMCATGELDPHVEEKLNARVRRPSPGFARALALAAIRETFEETGLAVGVSDRGAPENPPAGAWTRFAATGVTPALDAIDFLARAITPPGRVRRFDARFLIADARFVAKRVEGAIHPQAELVELVWTPLNEALNLDLPKITRKALEDLAQALGGGLDKTTAATLLPRAARQAPSRTALAPDLTSGLSRNPFGYRQAQRQPRRLDPEQIDQAADAVMSFRLDEKVHGGPAGPGNLRPYA